MATVKIDRFLGIRPIVHPSLLPDGMAVTAHNLKLKSGKIVPLRDPSPATGIVVSLENGLDDVAHAKSLHVWKKNDGSAELLAFPGITWMAGGNIADDDSSRIIVSGETGGEFVDDGGTVSTDVAEMFMRNSDGKRVITLCKNRLPAPRVHRITAKELDEANIRYTYFFWSWVDEFGYESPVSDKSLVPGSAEGSWIDGDLQYNDGDSVGFEPLGEYEIPPEAKLVRIYKVVTGTEQGRIQFVSEISRERAVDSSIGPSVSVKDEDAGEVITPIENPPFGLVNVIRVFGGGSFYAGCDRDHGKTVCFSDIDLPYSWPLGFRYDVDDTIVALATTSNSVFVLTDGFPYVISGTSPDSMTVYPLAGPAACVSARSVCTLRNAVYYASNDGIYVIANSADAGTVVTNLTAQTWSKDQWQAMNPSSCVMFQHDGALHMWMEDAGGVRRSFRIDLADGAAAVTTNDEFASCACVDNRTDKLYFVRAM